MSKRKYKKAGKVYSIAEITYAYNDEFFYWHDKIMHIGWLSSMPLRVVSNAIRNGMISRATKIKETK